MEIMRPFISLHGTGRDELVEQRMKAREAILAAIAALADMAPNGRDYAGEPSGFIRDRDIHCRRIAWLNGLYNALEDEALAIQDAGYAATGDEEDLQ